MTDTYFILAYNPIKNIALSYLLTNSDRLIHDNFGRYLC